VKLHVLGSGTAIPHPRRGASGYALVADDGTACLLECGPGSTRRWPSAGIDFETARIVVTTHHHVDHCCDLPAVLFGRNVPEPPVRTPLTLAGPVGHRAHVAAIDAMFGAWVADRHGVRAVEELSDGDVLSVPPFTLEAREVRHSPGALGVRVRCDGATVAFSGDSGPCDALVELCRGADLALLECSYPAGREAGRHLTTESAAEMAARARVRRLVLTHFYPACDAVDVRAEVRRAGYVDELHLAEDGDVLEVAPTAAP
jgi:ribonuclease BN (tRNA processing enzyme)